MEGKKPLDFNSLEYLIWEADAKAGTAPTAPVTELDLKKHNEEKLNGNA